ncbi:MAG: protein phosphatase 2C domain-containing protein [Gammaproteobacteria bacterium]|nr:protein phosphatase 2C domain-containing protein [Gammaproteobacteria bacterium]MCW8988391.1 protein phosphatase 2C domain-containing protein [Gammaproteobacteria bacterium]
MSDTTIRRPIKWNTSADTNVGMVRQINEDSIMAKPDIGLWAVADGMGGYEAGDVASKMIVSALENIEKHEYLNSFVDDIEDRIIDANHRILEYAEIMHDGRTLGSTVISLLIKGQVGVCLWAGDSRLYLLRNNQLQQISRDHSHVQELIDQGTITKEEALNHPDGNVITRAIGTSNELYVDIKAFNVQVGDTFLLCSDGLYNAVDEIDIEHHMRSHDTDNAVKQMIVTALENGAADNVSIVLVKSVSETNNSQKGINH